MWGLRKVGILALGLVLGVSWLSCCCRTASADLVLIGRDITKSFSSADAGFGPRVGPSGILGRLYRAEPPDACYELANQVEDRTNGSSPFVLVVRGGCRFDDKVRAAQEAGFEAAIVYDNIDYGHLITMSGSSDGIKIHAIFVSRSSGEFLEEYVGSTDTELLILPSGDYSALSILAVSFISLVAMFALLAICFYVQQRGLGQEPLGPCVGMFHRMSNRLVTSLPSLIFASVSEDNSTSQTCAICLEDYNVGEKLRILPCHHKFHALCVDAWLVSWRSFCPVCKHDARITTREIPASESTPLLSSTPASVASSPALPSSDRSSLASSLPVQITRASLSQLAPCTSSHPSTYATQSFRPYWQSPSVTSVSRSSVDLRSASSRRSQGSPSLASPLSVALGFPRYMSCPSSYTQNP